MKPARQTIWRAGFFDLFSIQESSPAAGADDALARKRKRERALCQTMF
jgi:hypothetical protein